MSQLAFDVAPDRTSSPSPVLSGTLTTGRSHADRRILDVEVLAVGAAGVELSGRSPLGPVRHAWLEVDLPGAGTIHALCEVASSTGASTSLRFVHLFPRDRRVLARFEAPASI